MPLIRRKSPKKKIATKVTKPIAITKSTTIKTIEIEESLARYFDSRLNIIVPNISFGLRGMHECDLFIIKPSAYVIEVEIKISKSDLLADSKKKHDHSDVRIREFYFAIPKNLLESCEGLIPEHAGILLCDRSEQTGLVNTITHRKPKINSKSRKLTSAEILKVARLGTMRIFPLKRKIIGLNAQIAELKLTSNL
jgi:hypothetical protein